MATLSLFAPSVSAPSLPPFTTLLIKGAYPPSSPLHFCISHLKSSLLPLDRQRVLFLTPDRQVFASALQDFNDGWLVENTMKGEFAQLFSKIDIQYAFRRYLVQGRERLNNAISYPPTAKHWLLLLSVMRPIASSMTTTHKLAVLPHTPSMIVLHEPSVYFTSSDQTSPYV